MKLSLSDNKFFSENEEYKLFLILGSVDTYLVSWSYTLNEKVLPSFILDDTDIFPPRNSQIFFEIVNPKPIPYWFI
jgi:hypothetical protein